MRIMIFIVLVLTSCGKEFLEYKYDKGVSTISKLSDLRALMDNSLSLFNAAGAYQLSLNANDEYYLETPQWQALPQVLDRNAYIYADDIYEQVQSSSDWNNCYQRIMVCNMVLEKGETLDINAEQQQELKEVVGTALFFRAFNYYQLAQVFCTAYDESTASLHLGLPLRLQSDVTIKSVRSDLAQTYKQVLDDLYRAAELLPVYTLNKFRPSRLAAWALLARIHLLMGNYERAAIYVDQVLIVSDDLCDFSVLDAKLRYPFVEDYGATNPDIVFYFKVGAPAAYSRARMHVAEELYNLYDDNDLRKVIYYDIGTINNRYFRGAMTGTSEFFAGLTLSELFLIRAEVNARKENITSVLQDLNKLRKARFKNFETLVASDLGEDPVAFVLDERRRELAFRALRWEDLRRLNKEPKYAKTLKRVIQDKTYTLAPNDLKYTYPIPPEVIRLGGIIQNER